MAGANPELERLAKQDYKYGFVTDIEEDRAPPGLTEDVVRLISSKKSEPEWLLEYRLKAFRRFREMLADENANPEWAKVDYPAIDYDEIVYYSAPKQQVKIDSLDDLDPELRATYDKLGISLLEQKRLNGIAVDAVFDSVSVATTFKAELEKKGIIFCSFSEAVQEHPDRSLFGQLLCLPERGCLQRWILRVHSKGRSLPDGTLDLLPNQRGRHWTIRTNIAHRR
jgi:Fe-S cluster assembly protein SufB